MTQTLKAPLTGSIMERVDDVHVAAALEDAATSLVEHESDLHVADDDNDDAIVGSTEQDCSGEGAVPTYDAAQANDSLLLAFPDAVVVKLLESQMKTGLLGLLGGLAEAGDTKTSPRVTEATDTILNSQAQPDEGHSPSFEDDGTFLLSMTVPESLLHADTPPITPVLVRQRIPPGLNIISSSPKRHIFTPPPCSYRFPRKGSGAHDHSNHDDKLDMGEILRHCDGHDNLLDVVEDWPSKPDAPEDWKNTSESLEKLENMRVRRAEEVLRARKQEAVEEPKHEESCFAWEEQYESLLDIAWLVPEEEEDGKEEEAYGTPRIRAFMAIKRRVFAGIDGKMRSTPWHLEPPPSYPLPLLPPSPT
ncbi:hypothetical protein LshimejAT787_0600180 [Lyophyllum shimeji]|uniref:Uncharacterized protein n=1 Tax=Lyophyllum shimeji TaxID=47721 RepID=A0A9P3PNG1_LYOSH|nr:hypothetical protein LshimejAT787_0600180 [Lyophyllum shimeji]